MSRPGTAAPSTPALPKTVAPAPVVAAVAGASQSGAAVAAQTVAARPPETIAPASPIPGDAGPVVLEPSSFSAAAAPAIGQPQPPITFLENRDQGDPAVKFVASTQSLTASFEQHAIGLQLGGRQQDFVRLAFEGASAGSRLAGEGPASDPGQAQTNGAAFSSVRYTGLYNGIDMRVDDAGGNLQYELFVAPGADVAGAMIHADGGSREGRRRRVADDSDAGRHAPRDGAGKLGRATRRDETSARVAFPRRRSRGLWFRGGRARPEPSAGDRPDSRAGADHRRAGQRRQRHGTLQYLLVVGHEQPQRRRRLQLAGEHLAHVHARSSTRTRSTARPPRTSSAAWRTAPTYWRVQAVDGALDQGTWSATQSFTITGASASAPGTPVLAPTQAYTTFHPLETGSTWWTPVPGAATYVWETSQGDPNFGWNNVFRQDNLDQTTFTFDMGFEGTFYSRVYAVSADGIRGVPSNVISYTYFYQQPRSGRRRRCCPPSAGRP